MNGANAVQATPWGQYVDGKLLAQDPEDHSNYCSGTDYYSDCQLP